MTLNVSVCCGTFAHVENKYKVQSRKDRARKREKKNSGFSMISKVSLPVLVNLSESQL